MPSWNRPYYGPRVDGSSKGPGWLGNIGSESRHITELSLGVSFNGEDTIIPAIVPGLTQDEQGFIRDNEKITPEIMQKAVEFAKMRRKLGLSPFKEISDLETGE
jgi:ABC-type molybdate transport system ATPase subunit